MTVYKRSPLLKVNELDGSITIEDGAGTDYAQLTIEGIQPAVTFIETDATADEGIWRITANGDTFAIATLDGPPVSAGQNAMSITRTAEVVEEFTIHANNFTYEAGTSTCIFTLEGGAPIMRWLETDGDADEKLWTAFVSAEQWSFGPASDAGSQTPAIVVERTTTTTDSIKLKATQIYLGPGAHNEYSIATGDVNIASAGDCVVTIRDETNNVEGFVVAGTGTVQFGSYTNHSVALYANNTLYVTISTSVKTAGGTVAATEGTDSFTGALTGYAAGPTGTVQVRRTGRRVSLTVTTAINGTSNANTLTMTGLPAAYRPAGAQSGPSMFLEDNGAGIGGAFYIAAAASTITFYTNPAAPASTGFTTSGEKGLLAGWRIEYDLD
jgi:hypothetical protein